MSATRTVKRQCGTCALPRFERTAKGGIKRKTPGICDAPIPDVAALLPASANIRPIWKAAVWFDEGEKCPAWIAPLEGRE